MARAGPEAIRELQEWLLDLTLEFNIGAVFMSNRPQASGVEAEVVDSDSDAPSVPALDKLLEEKGFKPSTPDTTSRANVATFGYNMTEDTQRHANGE